MSDIAIKFENVSKQYRLGSIGTGTLSHDLNRWWMMNIKGKEDPYLKIGQVNDRENKSTSDYVWALNDINFEVKQGEVLGIIGKNGAGKSTLLKILSRVTTPTTGRIVAHGRIASLLEVGTGFHPEMTGRENIYMNGSIMGMNKAEITRKLDEIVDFAGVEKYLDTPVKRYSSGMTVRLGFAIAAHLEPEILVVDEVLAVGDAEFQKKAIGRMKDVSDKEGRTVLFVSHNMQAITNLCNRVVLLNQGSVAQEGNALDIVRNYLLYESLKEGAIYWDDQTAKGDSIIKLKSIKIMDQDDNIRSHFFSKFKIKVQMDFIINQLENDLVIGFDVTNENGVTILRTYHNDGQPDNWPKLKLGLNSIVCELPEDFFNSGTFHISPKVSLHFKKWIINSDPLLSFEVEINHGVSPFWNRINKSNRPGSIAMILPWKAISTIK
ncbi:MAG: ABC transporter ATP-binding protein [Candidatus Saccharimonadaceae bacterium]